MGEEREGRPEHQDDEHSEEDNVHPPRAESLEGVRGVRVVVERINRAIDGDGSIRRQLQSNVESGLRNSGIRVLSEGEMLDEPEFPYLVVEADVKQHDEFCVYILSVGLLQEVILPLNETRISARTWWTTSANFSNQENWLEILYKQINNYIDRFIADYLQMNPEQKQT